MCTVLCGGPPFHRISLVLRITRLLSVVSCVVCVVLILKAVRFSSWGVGMYFFIYIHLFCMLHYLIAILHAIVFSFYII